MVFVVHSMKDKEWVSRLTADLNKRGVSTWVESENLRPGADWQKELEKALRECRAIVVVISSNSMQSPNLFFEIGAAFANDKTIIPVLIGDIKDLQLPVLLSTRNILRVRSPSEAGKLVAENIEKIGTNL